MIVRKPLNAMHVTIPSYARTLDGFRDWVRSEEFPDRGLISFIQGEIHVDMSPEKFKSHNQVKVEIDRVLAEFIRSRDLGIYCPDGLWITSDAADLSTEPDASFFRWETLESGRARLQKHQDSEDGIEMRGSPDWVLEIVSDTSVRKDTVLLPERYHRAGASEFWLIDARSDEISFDILCRVEDAFQSATQDVDGWQESKLFGRKFRLTRQRDRIGCWQYTLEHQEH